MLTVETLELQHTTENLRVSLCYRVDEATDSSRTLVAVDLVGQQLLIYAHLLYLFIYLGFLHHFKHCTGHIMTGSWKGRGNQYIQFVRVLYCKLPTNGKQLPAFPHEAVLGIEPRPQRWEARVLPLCHRATPPPTFALGLPLGATV